MKREALDVGTLPLLTFARAIAFSGKSRSTLNRAVASGELAVAGRCGGARGERVFRREDLEAWMLGQSVEAEAPIARRAPAATRPAPNVDDALARIRRAAAGARA